MSWRKGRRPASGKDEAMETLFRIGLENAAAPLPLALPVALLGLFLRRPAVLHALWVIVLLKLVTPPMNALGGLGAAAEAAISKLERAAAQMGDPPVYSKGLQNPNFTEEQRA